MRIRIRFSAVGVTLAGLITFSSALFAQTAPKSETRGYTGVGRIKWEFLPSFDYRFAVPHFTVGPRINCKGSRRHCEIRVASRDIDVGLEERREKLSAELTPYVERSKEKAIQLRTSGAAPQVMYATLTDSRPGPGEFRLLTLGFSVNGPAVIHFELQSNSVHDIRKILAVVQRARTIDALGIWAWKLKDYKIVCEERFPALKEANDAAFQSSPFSSVDILGFWQTLTPSESREEIQGSLEAGRGSYAKGFDDRPLLDKQGFCASLPTSMAEAAKGLSAK